MWTFKFNILTFLLCVVGLFGSHGLQDVTTDLFGTENNGTVAAFGDLNSDKQTDIFIIREESEVVIFLADPKMPYFKPKVRITKDILSSAVVTSVVPGDFDGDSQMDLLVTTKNKAKTGTNVVIFWGNNKTLDLSDSLQLNKTFKDQPLVMDFNGDMIPDVFGVPNTSSMSEVCYLTKRTQHWQSALSSAVNLRIPHSNAFIDLNKDFTADLFLTTEGPMFETWISKDGKFTKADIMPSTPPVKNVGQSSFVDFAHL